jgi:type I restriction enzyme S subunit
LEIGVSGSTRQAVTKSDLERHIFPIPPLKDQQLIVERLDSLSVNIRKLEDIQRKTIAECDALKQALLRKVFE